MAIQISLTTPDGVAHPQAYGRLTYSQFDNEGQQAVLIVKLYDSAATRTAGNAPVQVNTYNIGPDVFPAYFADAVLQKTTPSAQAYKYLMGVPDFKGGTAV